MEAGLPIRTQVIRRTSSQSALERHNRAQGRKSVSSFRPAEEAVEAIWNTGRPSPGRIRGWIEHPDEVVPVAVAERHLHQALWGPRWESVLGIVLLERAQNDAQSEGLLWTPLLDLASRVVDPEATGKGAPPLELIFLLDELPEAHREGALEALAGFHSLPLIQEVGRRTEAPSPDLLKTLLARKGGALGLARNPTLSDEGKEAVSQWVVRHLGEDVASTTGRKKGEIWGRATQPALVVEALLQSCWAPTEDFRSTIHQKASFRPTEPRAPARSRLLLEKRFSGALTLCVLGSPDGLLLVEEFVRGRKVPLEPTGIRWLGKRGLLSPSVRKAVIRNGRDREEIRAMISVGGLLTKEEMIILLKRGVIRPTRSREPAFGAGEVLREYLKDHPQDSSTVLEAAREMLAGEAAGESGNSRYTPAQALPLLLRLARREEDLLGLRPMRDPEEVGGAALAAHSRAGVRLWKELLDWGKGREWRLVLAKAARARRHPEIRPRLHAMRDLDVYRELLMDGIPSEFEEILPRLVSVAPDVVLDVLSRSPQEVMRSVDPSVLKPLFLSKDPDLRARAFEALGGMGAEE